MSAPWMARFVGQRRGMAFDKPVRILTVASSGVRCRFPDGHVERVHPDDLVTGAEMSRPA